MPWEADAFYAQPGMAERALTLDVWPVGTGAYMMVEFVKDRYHVMKRNPNYRVETQAVGVLIAALVAHAPQMASQRRPQAAQARPVSGGVQRLGGGQQIGLLAH